MMYNEVMKHSEKRDAIEVQSSGQVRESGSTSTVNSAPYVSRRPVPPFLDSLHKIVTNGRQSIVRWDSGDPSRAQLVIINKMVFLEEEVPQFTAAIKWDSFKRNLYNYGFRKVGKSVPGDTSSMWGHEKLRGQTADNILLLKRHVAQPLKLSESNTPNDNAKDKKGASEAPLSTLFIPPLEFPRNEHLFSTISPEISTGGLSTIPPAGGFPSTLMVVPESCSIQSTCIYDPAAGDSHPESVVDPELLTHPVPNVLSLPQYIGSKNTVENVKDKSSTRETVQFSAKHAQLECMRSDGAMARRKVIRTMSVSGNANCFSALEEANRFTAHQIGQAKLDIPSTEITERGMKLISARDINNILNVSDVASSSTSWSSLGLDGAIRHQPDNIENRTCGLTKTKMKVGHGNRSLRDAETMNIVSDTSFTGKSTVRQPLDISVQHNIHRGSNTSPTLPGELEYHHKGTENGNENTFGSVTLVPGEP